MQRKLQQIFENKVWRGSARGARSGPGSTLEFTARLRAALPSVFERYAVSSFLDAPCGDWHWMNSVDLGGVTYIGGDIASSIVEHNEAEYSGEGVRFVHLDITSDPLPDADLMMCRDCLFHLTDECRWQFFENFMASNIPYLMMTMHHLRANRSLTRSGNFAPFSPLAEPFNFPEPIEMIHETMNELPANLDQQERPRKYRSLGIWHRDGIADALTRSKAKARAQEAAANTNFIMVLDGRGFEAMSILAAASIRRVHGWTAKILAYAPVSKLHEISERYREAADVFGISVVPFDNSDAGWVRPYPHGNKMLAMAEQRGANTDVFLDTDTMLFRPFDAKVFAAIDTISVVPEGVPTWGRNHNDWAPVYEHFGLDLPDFRVRAVRGRRRQMLPYFNAGLVVAPTKLSEGRNFGRVWLETAVEIDRNVPVNNKRPWLDQIALPIAIARAGADTNVLDASYNYSLHRRTGDLPPETKMAHYHIPGAVRSFPMLHEVIDFAEALWPGEEGAKRTLEVFRRPIRRKKRAQLGLNP